MIAHARASATVADELALLALPEDVRDMVSRLYGVDGERHADCGDECDCYLQGRYDGRRAAEADAEEETAKRKGALADRVRQAFLLGVSFARAEGNAQRTGEALCNAALPEMHHLLEDLDA